MPEFQEGKISGTNPLHLIHYIKYFLFIYNILLRQKTMCSQS